MRSEAKPPTSAAEQFKDGVPEITVFLSNRIGIVFAQRTWRVALV
jgi:hypothetical protein